MTMTNAIGQLEQEFRLTKRHFLRLFGFISLMILCPFFATASAEMKTTVKAEQYFDDVPVDYWAFSEIDKLVGAFITRGCSVNPKLFCPDERVTRAQMAVFLERAMGRGGREPSFSRPWAICFSTCRRIIGRRISSSCFMMTA